MSSQVIINNSKKYRLEFSDSIYAFNEDLEYTVDHYCSIREVEYDDIGKLLFVLHSHISKLKNNDGISEVLIKLNGLENYGEGPLYENEEYYYVLGGSFLIKDICSQFVLLESDDKNILIKIISEDFDLLNEDEIENLEKTEILCFEGMTSAIFVNEKQKNNIIRLLHQDIKNLNKLLSELKLNNRIVSITKPKLH